MTKVAGFDAIDYSYYFDKNCEDVLGDGYKEYAKKIRERLNEVTVFDALMLIRAIINNRTIANGDVNGDGKVTLIDVIRVIKLIAQ